MTNKSTGKDVAKIGRVTTANHWPWAIRHGSWGINANHPSWMGNRQLFVENAWWCGCFLDLSWISQAPSTHFLVAFLPSTPCDRSAEWRGDAIGHLPHGLPQMGTSRGSPQNKGTSGAVNFWDVNKRGTDRFSMRSLTWCGLLMIKTYQNISK